jgi:hypothetical protein
LTDGQWRVSWRSCHHGETGRAGRAVGHDLPGVPRAEALDDRSASAPSATSPPGTTPAARRPTTADVHDSPLLYAARVNGPTVDPARARLAQEQPGRGFAPAGAAPRTEDAALQVARLRPACQTRPARALKVDPQHKQRFAGPTPAPIHTSTRSPYASLELSFLQGTTAGLKEAMQRCPAEPHSALGI